MGGRGRSTSARLGGGAGRRGGASWLACGAWLRPLTRAGDVPRCADNGIGAEGAKALAEALRHNTALQGLYMPGRGVRVP